MTDMQAKQLLEYAIRIRRQIHQYPEVGFELERTVKVDAGVMEGVSYIIGSHCENSLEVGLLGVHEGEYMTACIPATIRFYGKSAHATRPDAGVDAVAMAVEAYCRMKEMVKKEAGSNRYIWSVGRFAGGEVHNIIADLCTLDISFRFFNMDFAKRVGDQVHSICQEVAQSYGGSVEIDWHMSTEPVCNDAAVVERFCKAAASQSLEVRDQAQRLSSEDFGWYQTKVPGLMFRFGTRNEALGCTGVAHQTDFKIDESGMEPAIRVFIACALQD